MWEFGKIARHLLDGKGYQYPALSRAVPSAYMPPGLPFIYFMFFKLIGDNSSAYVSILLLNSVLAGISIYLVYFLSKLLYTEKTALLSSVYVCISPAMIFSTINFNSIIIYHVLISLAYIYYLKYENQIERSNSKTFNYKNIIILGLIMGVFLYFRSEMTGLLFILTFLFIVKKRFVSGIILLLIPILLILPWTIRNYNTFGKFVLITTSMGYNFYKGHGNEESTVNYKQNINNLKEDSTFEIKKSEISVDMALNYIKDHPEEEIQESFKKIYSLWVIDAYRENAKHPLYLVTWLPTLLLFIWGFYFSLKDNILKKKLSFLMIYLLFSTILAVIFFNIPRYQIQMSFIMIPTSMFGLQCLINSINKIISKK